MSKRITKEIFEQFQQGQHAAFRQIMIMYSPMVFETIRKIVKSSCDAEELTQDVFMKMWNNRTTFHSIAAMIAFLLKVTRNDALNFLRNNNKTADLNQPLSEHTDLPSALFPDVESEYLSGELELLIVVAVEHMPPQRRDVFKMSRFEGLSHTEIAAKLNISPITVSRHLTMSLAELKGMLFSLAIVLSPIIRVKLLIAIGLL